MSDKKPCIRCGRGIDAYAKNCVYCNWDQSVAPPVEGTENIVGAAPAYIAPKDNRVRNRVLGIGGFIVLLIAAFSIGTFMHGFDPNEVSTLRDDKPVVTVTGGASNPAPSRPDLQVIPANPNNTVAGEAPITSAPATTTAAGVPNEYQRNDATAATSEEYAQLAARAKAERQTLGVDPRTVGGPAYGGAQPHRRIPSTQPRSGLPSPIPGAMTSASPNGSGFPSVASNGSPNGEPQPGRILLRTRAQPEYQPIPQIRVDRDTTARLDLTIGDDGRVRDVNILNAIPGETAKLIAAVQAWRFKPATENGRPVPSHFSVDISFKP
ncbi:MAG: putative sensor protein [Acidobacteria bacterium]|nr:putative sensor protein [Acidobacteriota bacterium]